MLLEKLQPTDIRRLNESDKCALCEEIRSVIIDTVTKGGGHLASNLGAVESTVALFSVFDFPKDKIVFDVGHQCYPYKLLSGRYEKFNTLRKENGISGFPKRSESAFDCYDTGHAGTAISAALGIAKARDLKGENYQVIAYVGDGSFNNGLVYEALTSMQILKTKILIILNDNGMSISPTVGGMHDILNDLRSETEKKSEGIKLLESFGLTYLGVKDGNNCKEMTQSLEQAKELLKMNSVLLHIHTKKGKGYEFSEDEPTLTHGVPSLGAKKEREYSEVLGETLCQLAKTDKTIAVVCAAMLDSLGLKQFFANFPERAFDVGICEENASVLCASMGTAGLKPYYAIYSTFLQRSFDEIIHDVCQQDAPVTFCIDRAGISGPDGETHQGVFDLSYLSLIPNLTICAPKDTEEFKELLYFSANYPHPLAIRYPRNGVIKFNSENKKIELGKWEYLQSENSNVTVIAEGERCLTMAMEIAENLKNKGLFIDVINARFIKPLDEKMLSSIKSNYIVTIEDNVFLGGLGAMIDGWFARNNKRHIVKNFAYDDKFIPHGSVKSLQNRFGVNKDEIESYITEVLK